MNNKNFKEAFKTSVPVLLGYLAIGIAFGMLLVKQGYPWYLGVLMSIFIYAGAGQFIAVGLFAAGVDLVQALIITFFVNCRHMVYGLSLLDKFKGIPFKTKLYLIFSLTDETYALLTTVNPQDSHDKSKFYFFVSFLDQLYWVLGTLIGTIAGSLIPFDFKGIDFALTALFAVLFIEQYKACRVKTPFILAGVSALIAILINKNNMLIISISLYIISLITAKEFIRKKENLLC